MFYPRSPYSQSRPRAAGYRAAILCFGNTKRTCQVRTINVRLAWQIGNHLNFLSISADDLQSRHAGEPSFDHLVGKPRSKSSRRLGRGRRRDIHLDAFRHHRGAVEVCAAAYREQGCRRH